MRDWITKDIAWKLFSLFLAVAIWLTVHKIYEEPRNNFTGARSTTLTYDNLPVLPVSGTADVHDFRVVPATVKVTVVGPRDVMAKLQAGEIHAEADLTDIEAARDSYRDVQISTPPGVTLVSVDPASVTVIPPPKP